MGVLIAILATLFLAGCASAPTQESTPPRQIVCRPGPDCDAKWSRAVSWVTTNSSYKIQAQTDSIIQTMGPLRYDTRPAFTVTKVALPNGSYEITFNGGCDNIIECIPSVSESRTKFTDFVLAVEATTTPATRIR